MADKAATSTSGSRRSSSSRGPRGDVLGRVSAEKGCVFLQEIEIPDQALRDVERSSSWPAATSWLRAGCEYLIESIARSRWRWITGRVPLIRQPIVSKNTLAVVITQSGETADTLAALREARKHWARSIAICNVVGSMATRETEGTVHARRAGDRRRLDQAFTSQLVGAAPAGCPTSGRSAAPSHPTRAAHIEALTAAAAAGADAQVRAGHRGDRPARPISRRLFSISARGSTIRSRSRGRSS